MWETIKNDPLLKSIVVVVFGVLAFGFAFNVMFGSRGGMMGEGMEMGGSTANSFSSNLTYMLVALFKILLIVLVIAVIILLVKVFKKYVIDGNKFEMKNLEALKQEPRMKWVIGSGAGLLLLLVVVFLMSGFTGRNAAYAAMQGNTYSLMGSTAGGSFISLLSILFKFTLFLSFIGALIGGGMLLKEKHLSENPSDKKAAAPEVQCPNCSKLVSETAHFCPNCGSSLKNVCPTCGIEIKEGWNCCPECGTENKVAAKATESKNAEANTTGPQEGVSVENKDV